MALDWLPIYPDWFPQRANSGLFTGGSPQRFPIGYARASSYPVLDLEGGPGDARTSSYTVLDLEGGPGDARTASYPLLLLYVPGLDWFPLYPSWFPPKQKAREGQFVLARVPGPFSVTQYVIEAWLPNDEPTFDNAETVGLAWVEVLFREG